MSGYNKHSGEAMRIIVVFRKYYCDYRKTNKHYDRKEENSGDDSDRKVKRN